MGLRLCMCDLKHLVSQIDASDLGTGIVQSKGNSCSACGDVEYLLAGKWREHFNDGLQLENVIAAAAIAGEAVLIVLCSFNRILRLVVSIPAVRVLRIAFVHKPGNSANNRR